jgi:O-antigen/teichoic acid export membrane protein
MHARIRRILDRATSDRIFNSLLKGSAVVFMAKSLSVVLLFLVTAMVGRAYGAAALGHVAVVTAIMTLAMLFANLGLKTSLMHFAVRSLTHNKVSDVLIACRRAMAIISVTSILAGLLLMGLSETASTIFLNDPALFYMLVVAGNLLIFKVIVEVTTQTVRAFSGTLPYAVMQVLPAAFNVLILIFALQSGLGADWAIWAYCGSFVLTMPFGLYFMWRAIRLRMPQDSGEPQSAPSMKEMLVVSLPMMFSGLFSYLMPLTGQLYLAYDRSPEEVGIFSVALKIATSLSFVLFAVNAVAAPIFSRLYHQGKSAELFTVARKSSRMIFWMVFPVIVVLALSGQWLLEGIFGPEFASGYLALMILLAASTILASVGSVDFLMNMTGHQKALRNIILIALVVSFVVCVALIPSWGLNGAAMAYLAGVAVWRLGALFFLHRQHGIWVGYLPLISRAANVRDPAGGPD